MAETIIIGTKVDLGGLKKGEKGISDSVTKMSSTFDSGSGSMELFGSSLTSIAGGATLALTAIAGLTIGVGKYAVAQSEMARELKRVADNSDIATSSVSGIATAFISAGADIDMASDFIQDFTERLGDAKAGSGSLQEAFNELGVDINGSTESALRQTISTLGSMEDRQRSLFRGIELFGDTYKTVAQDISNGSDLMSNGMFSDNFINNSDRLQRNIGGIKTAFQETMNDAIEPLMEDLADLTSWLLDSGAIEAFTDHVKTLTSTMMFLADNFDIVGIAIKGVTDDVSALTNEDAAKKLVPAFLGLERTITILNSQSAEAVETDRALITQKEEQLESIRRQIQSLRGLKQTQDLIYFDGQNRLAVETAIAYSIKEQVDSANELNKAWGMSELENAMIDSMDRIRAEAVRNRLERERIAREEALALLGIEIESHENRKQQRTDARDQELLLFQDTQDAKKQLAMEGAQFAYDIGNSFFEMSMSRDERELAQWKKTQDAKNSGLIVTSRRRAQIEEASAKEIEKREVEIAKKRGAMQISMGWADAGRGIIGTWSQALSSAPPAFAIPMAIASSAMMTGVATANTAQIASSMQGFEMGGVVKQEAGVPSTGDMHTVRVNPNEEILTADDPRHINNGGGGGNFTIHIGTLTQDTLVELEDNIRALQSAGRTSIDLVS